MLSQPPAVFTKAPTTRTLKKGARDFGSALLGFCVAYTVAHQVDIGLTPEASAAVGPLAIFAVRYLRGVLGMEPIE